MPFWYQEDSTISVGLVSERDSVTQVVRVPGRKACWDMVGRGSAGLSEAVVRLLHDSWGAAEAQEWTLLEGA